MDNQRASAPSGNLVISEEVIASIAVNAAKDVEGVASLVPRPANVRTALHFGEGVQRLVNIAVADNEIRIHLYLRLKSGAKLPFVCDRVQSRVKDAVQSMTGRIVSRVDVSVLGIDFSQKMDHQEQ
ncbi:MAG TPA: Asp23/Gls24 family envelope stress response protein [Candidatus Onthovicinus excrementipullorum]|nr:Asp23/Gls24 family envelope stress response protein [Candidatus Onthovicinus excrementipullorum]